MLLFYSWCWTVTVTVTHASSSAVLSFLAHPAILLFHPFKMYYFKISHLQLEHILISQFYLFIIYVFHVSWAMMVWLNTNSAAINSFEIIIIRYLRKQSFARLKSFFYPFRHLPVGFAPPKIFDYSLKMKMYGTRTREHIHAIYAYLCLVILSMSNYGWIFIFKSSTYWQNPGFCWIACILEPSFHMSFFLLLLAILWN